MTGRLPGYVPDHAGPVPLGDHFHAFVEGVAVADVSVGGSRAPRVILLARIDGPGGTFVEIVLEPEDTSALAAMAHEAGVRRASA